MQRRARWIAAAVAIGIAIVAIPLIVLPERRLDLGYQLGFVPDGGNSIEKIASPDDGEVLVVIPFHEANDAYGSAYRQRAQYLARPDGDRMTLEDLSTGITITLPLGSIDFIAASEDGQTILFRQGTAPASARTALVDVGSGKVTMLASGTMTPDLPGDWTTPVWARIGTHCGMRSVTSIYVACFPRPTLATYLFGDWQLDLQKYGDYKIATSLFRGMGFLPSVGWTNDDRSLYFQNERGIWKIDLGPNPLDLTATPGP